MTSSHSVSFPLKQAVTKKNPHYPLLHCYSSTCPHLNDMADHHTSFLLAPSLLHYFNAFKGLSDTTHFCRTYKIFQGGLSFASSHHQQRRLSLG